MDKRGIEESITAQLYRRIIEMYREGSYKSIKLIIGYLAPSPWPPPDHIPVYKRKLGQETLK
jgi:hypothetical protein